MLLSIEGLREDKILQNVSKLHTMLLNLESLACKVCIYVLILRMYIVSQLFAIQTYNNYSQHNNSNNSQHVLTYYLVLHFHKLKPIIQNWQYECSSRHFTDSYSSEVTDLVSTLRGYVHKYKSQL